MNNCRERIDKNRNLIKVDNVPFPKIPDNYEIKTIFIEGISDISFTCVLYKAVELNKEKEDDDLSKFSDKDRKRLFF